MPRNTSGSRQGQTPIQTQSGATISPAMLESQGIETGTKRKDLLRHINALVPSSGPGVGGGRRASEEEVRDAPGFEGFVQRARGAGFDPDELVANRGYRLGDPMHEASLGENLTKAYLIAAIGAGAAGAATGSASAAGGAGAGSGAGSGAGALSQVSVPASASTMSVPSASGVVMPSAAGAGSGMASMPSLGSAAGSSGAGGGSGALSQISVNQPRMISSPSPGSGVITPANMGNAAAGSGSGGSSLMDMMDRIPGGGGGGGRQGQRGGSGPEGPGTTDANPSLGDRFQNFYTKGTEGDRSPRWGRIAGSSLGALAMLSGMGGSGRGSGRVGFSSTGGLGNPGGIRQRANLGMDQSDYYSYGQTGPEANFFNYGARGFKAGGGVAGPGSGRDDVIKANLSDGEYVIDAESVAMLGDGSTDAGIKRLDEMRKNLRKHKGGALSEGKFSPNAKKPEKYMSGVGGGKKSGSSEETSDDVSAETFKKIKSMFDEGGPVKMEWMDIAKDPTFDGVFAVRGKVSGDESPYDFLVDETRVNAGDTDNAVEEVEFPQWPPSRGDGSRPFGMAEGGSVVERRRRAVAELLDLADRFEKATSSEGVGERAKEIADQMDITHRDSGKIARAEFSRGGDVMKTIGKIMHKIGAVPGEDSVDPVIKRLRSQGSETDAQREQRVQQLMKELERLDPESRSLNNVRSVEETRKENPGMSLEQLREIVPMNRRN